MFLSRKDGIPKTTEFEYALTHCFSSWLRDCNRSFCPSHLFEPVLGPKLADVVDRCSSHASAGFRGDVETWHHLITVVTTVEINLQTIQIYRSHTYLTGVKIKKTPESRGPQRRHLRTNSTGNRILN